MLLLLILIMLLLAAKKKKSPGLWKFNSLLDDESFVVLITKITRLYAENMYIWQPKAETGIDWDGDSKLNNP